MTGFAGNSGQEIRDCQWLTIARNERAANP
jgi:hypothetical protein